MLFSLVDVIVMASIVGYNGVTLTSQDLTPWFNLLHNLSFRLVYLLTHLPIPTNPFHSNRLRPADTKLSFPPSVLKRSSHPLTNWVIEFTLPPALQPSVRHPAGSHRGCSNPVLVSAPVDSKRLWAAVYQLSAAAFACARATAQNE